MLPVKDPAGAVPDTLPVTLPVSGPVNLVALTPSAVEIVATSTRADVGDPTGVTVNTILLPCAVVV